MKNLRNYILLRSGWLCTASPIRRGNFILGMDANQSKYYILPKSVAYVVLFADVDKPILPRVTENKGELAHGLCQRSEIPDALLTMSA